MNAQPQPTDSESIEQAAEFGPEGFEHDAEQSWSSSRKLYLERGVRRVQRLQQRLQELSRRLSIARVLCFVLSLALFIGLTEFQYGLLAGLQLLCSTVGFIVLVKKHQDIKRQLARCYRSLKLKQHDIGRICIDWKQIPERPEEVSLPDHPFEVDLDITGQYSLFRLMHTCLTHEGSERLKSYLLSTEPEPQSLEQRQARVRALRSQIVFREKLDLAVYETALKFRHGGAQDWKSAEVLESLEHVPERRVRGSLILLSLMAVGTWILWLASQWGLSSSYWQLSLSLYIVAFWAQRQKINRLFNESQSLQYQLYRLQSVFEILEHYAPTRGENLKAFFEAFLDQTQKPSLHVKKLGRIVAGASLQGNPLLWVGANLLVPWDYYFAWRLERLKPTLKAHLPHWLETLWELEALNALAHYAWLHPEAPFPEWSTGSPAYAARGLGHPLLPPQHKVRNDFELQTLGQAILLTGSNMAGKSTFLKSVGLNAVLAQAGTVVDARQLSLVHLRLRSCIKVSDSVIDGISYFYAEVRRLKQVLQAIEEAHALPVLFLVDEIFKGTNNRERLIGSRSYLKALTGKNALGGVSTHDLELVQVAENNPQLSNYHFREYIQNQRMVFDYRLYAGPSPTTNALKIMEIEGLPLEHTAE